MDEERAQVEEVLQRGEQMLHEPMEENKKEKIRLQLLLLRTKYNKTKVLSWESLCSTWTYLALAIQIFDVAFMDILKNRWNNIYY